MNQDRLKRLNRERILKIIQTDGLLSEKMKGFEAREAQQKMLTDIMDVYNNEGIALIEAGTGTGKSIAYLLPALIWASLNGERTLISTNTIALQEQLINKDIPLLTKALGLEVKAILVKGMNNYLCLRKLNDLKHEIQTLAPEELKELDLLEAWGHTTSEGSRSDLKFVPSYAAWEKVNADKEACSNRECEYYKECFFFRARRQATDAHILVANHYMLFADLAVSQSEEGKNTPGLLPKYSRVILDEAHHIEDVATEFLALKSSKLGLLHILSKLTGEKQGKINALKQKIQQYYKGNFPKEIASVYSRLNIDFPAARRNLYQEIDHMFLSYEELMRTFNLQEERSVTEGKLRILPTHLTHEDWKNDIIPYTKKLIDSLKLFNISLYNLLKDLAIQRDEKLDEALKSVKLDIEGAMSRLTTAIETLIQFIEVPEPSQVRWIESQTVREVSNTHLINAQLDIAKALNKTLFSPFPTVVLCSATLTTNKEFKFFRERLGLTKEHIKEKRITENRYESPFDFQRQAFFGVPTDIPEPHRPDFIPKAVEQIWHAIEASRGNAFILFTSYQMLQECFSMLETRLQEKRYVAMKQGDTNRQSLIDRFKATDRSVLFGTDSFWEGVDVSGDALRCVVIVKLPFKVPSDPIIQARTECITADGGNSFNDYLLPNAIVKFTQGVGRLIRKKSDRGCIICLDSRLVSKQYGKFFLNSLPDCQQVFMEGKLLKEKMVDFYKKTYHLVKQG